MPKLTTSMKKFAIALLIVLAVLAAVGAYLFLRPRVSPAATASIDAAGTKITVSYSSPVKKGRLIFGAHDTKALVPYGEVWRTGANEATEITFSKDVIIGGKPLKAGKYTLFTIPDRDKWTAIINGETGQWGLFYKEAKDVLRTEATVQTSAEVAEAFVIRLEKSDTGATLVMHWDTTTASLPIQVQ